MAFCVPSKEYFNLEMQISVLEQHLEFVEEQIVFQKEKSAVESSKVGIVLWSFEGLKVVSFEKSVYVAFSVDYVDDFNTIG